MATDDVGIGRTFTRIVDVAGGGPLADGAADTDGTADTSGVVDGVGSGCELPRHPTSVAKMPTPVTIDPANLSMSACTFNVRAEAQLGVRMPAASATSSDLPGTRPSTRTSTALMSSADTT